MKTINVPFFPFLLQGIPEQIAVVTLAYVIAHLPLKWSRIVVIGTILAIGAFTMRQLSLPFGLHTVLIIFILFIVLIRPVKGDLSKALIVSIISYLILIALEIVCFYLLVPAFGVEIETLSTDVVVRTLMGLPQVVLLFVVAYCINKLKRGQLQ